MVSTIKRRSLVLMAAMMLLASISLYFASSPVSAASCAPTRSTSWGYGRVCGQNGDVHNVRLDDTRTDGYCVEVRHYSNNNSTWVRTSKVMNQPVARSCGSPVSTQVGFGNASVRGLRLYRDNGSYTTLCDAAGYGVSGVPTCNSLRY